MMDDPCNPPDSPACLSRLRPLGQKGGTLIAEGVLDRETHLRRLRAPGGYRPASCLNCGERVLHVHDYRERCLRAEPDGPVEMVVRHACAACHARWLTLPEFIARGLWRSWRVVERATIASSAPRGPPVPKRTVRRWRERLRSAARFLIQLLATSGDAVLSGLATRLGMNATRRELVVASAAAMDTPADRRLAMPAAMIHRLAPGVRLM
jgi:hypothetical protein